MAAIRGNCCGIYISPFHAITFCYVIMKLCEFCIQEKLLHNHWLSVIKIVTV